MIDLSEIDVGAGAECSRFSLRGPARGQVYASCE